MSDHESARLWQNAKNEWDQIEENVISVQPEKSKISTDSAVADYSFKNITSLNFLQQTELNLEASDQDFALDFKPSFCCFCPNSPEKLQVKYADLETKRRKFLCLTTAKFDESNSTHVDSLFTIFISLNYLFQKSELLAKNKNVTAKGESMSNIENIDLADIQLVENIQPSRPPRFGKHWNLIGFQGSDPKTDFRAAGLLPIFLILKNLEIDTKNKIIADYENAKNFPTQNSKFYQIFRKFRENISEDDNFPFCLVCINITVRIINFILRRPVVFYQLQLAIDQIFIESLEFFVDTWIENDFNIRDAQKCLQMVEHKIQKY